MTDNSALAPIEIDGKITDTSHLGFRMNNYEERLFRRALSAFDATFYNNPKVVEEMYKGLEVSPLADTEGAYARAGAAMTTLFEPSKANPLPEFVQTDEDSINYSQRLFFMRELSQQYAARAILKAQDQEKYDQLSLIEQFKQAQDILVKISALAKKENRTPEEQAKVDTFSGAYQQYQQYLPMALSLRLFSQDPTNQQEISNEMAYHLAYSITVSDYDPKGKLGDNAFMEEIRNDPEFTAAIDTIKQVASTLDRDEIINIVQSGFSNKIEEPFTVGENTQGIDPTLQVSERWALAAAAVAEANQNLNTLFPDQNLTATTVIPFPNPPQKQAALENNPLLSPAAAATRR